MKPKLKAELVRVEYWDCGNPDHRHKTAGVALACIEKCEKRTAINTGALRWTNEALAEMLAEHRAGARQCDLSKRLGLSRSRVGQVLAMAERRERSVDQNDPLNTLSTKVRNLLRTENLLTVEAVREALVDGRLDHMPGFGVVGKGEVLRWLDLLPSNDKAKGGAPLRCPSRS